MSSQTLIIIAMSALIITAVIAYKMGQKKCNQPTKNNVEVKMPILTPADLSCKPKYMYGRTTGIMS